MASDNNSDMTAPAPAPVVTRQEARTGSGQFWARVSDGRLAKDLDFAAPERAPERRDVQEFSIPQDRFLEMEMETERCSIPAAQRETQWESMPQGRLRLRGRPQAEAICDSIPADRLQWESMPPGRLRLRGRPQAEVTEKPWCIPKVPHRQREVNEKAYEPNVISIGPYHHGKQHLRAMEAIKRSCFVKIVEETRRDFSSFHEAMIPLEVRARNCYEEPFPLHTTGFVEMMILDGCFIVQLIRGVHPEEDIFEVGRIQTDIRFDLILLENQLPFFVLFQLYRIIVPNAGGDVHDFARLVLSNLFNISDPSLPRKEIKHLLDLVHCNNHPSRQGIAQHQYFKAKATAEEREPSSQRSWKFIRSATELEDAGIRFFGDKVEKMKDVRQGIEHMFDIMFTKDTKVLKIPTLQVDDGTERFFRNFMAYEQFFPSGEPTYFVDYVVFMDNLINTGQDVQLLCKSGVIDNWMGDDEAVAQMFNKLRDSIYMSEDFYYAEIFGRVNQHCQRKRNKWKAALKKNYFNTPWSLISFLAACALLVLTLLQTIFSILSYIKQ